MDARDAEDMARAKAELEERSEWLRITLSSIGDAVIATDAAGRVTFMNGVAEALTGWPIADAAGHPLTEIFVIVHETTRKPTDNPALRALREGTVVGLANHTVLIARDGRETPIDDSAAPMWSETGAPLGAVLVFRDVGERRRAEEANARLAAIVESSEDAIVSKALDGTILSWNRGAARIFGWTAAEAVGKSVLILVPPERHEEERRILERLRHGEHIEPFETERVTKDGRRIDISLTVSPIRNAEGEVVGASKIARDITAKKRAELEQARLAEHLRLAMSAADLGTWDWDPATDVITLSERAAEIYDVTPGGHIREQMRAAIRAEHRDRARQLAAKAAAEHIDYDIEYILDRPRGPVWVAARGRGAYDASGKLTRMFGVVADVTDRKDAEIALRESEARARFFADLAAATQPLTDPAQMMATSARLLAEHLGVDRCAYAEVEDESIFVITGDYAREVPSIVGRWPVAAFGEGCLRAMLANEPYVVDDVDGDPRITDADRPAYRATTIKAVICVPLHKDGRFTAAMAVHQTAARRWTPAELDVVTSVVGRCWEALERSRVTRTLQLSEARYRAIVETTPECVKVIASDGTLLQMNRAGLAMIEAGDAALGKSFYDLIAPHDRDAVRALVARVCGGEAGTMEYDAIGGGGALRRMETSAVPLPTQGGGATMLAVTRDVTVRRAIEAERERLHAEAELERGRLSEIFQLAPSFMGVLRGPEHVFERLNDRYVELISGRSAVGKPVREALPEVVAQGFIELLDGVYRTGEPYVGTNARVTLRRPDGSMEDAVLDFVYQPMRDASGTVSGIIVQGIDLTHRYRAEAELRRVTEESERRRRLYETVLSNTPDLMYVFGLDHRFTLANAALLQMWGRTWEDAIGRNCLELGYEPWHAEMHDREIDQVIATKRPIRGEVPFTGTNGRRIYDYIFAPVLGADGEVEAVAGTTRDVTDRKAMEQELRDTDRRKDEFIALLAHELRNPLAPIRNGLQIMQLAEEEEERDQVRAMMDRQLSHMVRLIDDLLDVSRIGQSKMELRRARVTLSDVITNAVETARPMIEEARHDLTIALPATPIYLDADLTRLAQVFGNLLTNSAKYTPRGGRISIAAERRDGRVAVAVCDDGIGIPADSLPRIFDMFSQVDRSIERSSGGLGIGLALVKGLVEMHGGTVTAESEGQGKGSTFTVTLPVLAEQADRAAAAGAPKRPPPGPRRRILVVDDNRDAADSLAIMLRLMGNDVQTAGDGMEAVETAERFRPEIIFMDVGMPRLNGYEATRLIRTKEWSKGVSIFALTGWGQEGDRENSREAGCDGHLVKPIHVPDLRKLLAELGKPGGGPPSVPS